jgi:hypothetical protein
MTDCVLWYPLTEGTGSTATDLVGSNDGTVGSDLSWNDVSTIGTALQFNDLQEDSNNVVTTPTVTTVSQPVTHSLWFRYAGFSGSAYVMDGLNGSFRNTIYFSSSQMWVFSGSSSGTIGSSGQFNDGEWHNLTAVFNGSSSVVYIDGVQESSGNYGSHTWQGTTLGARYNFVSALTGDLQNYRVWERALTAEEARLLFERPWIGADYNETAPLYPPVPSSLTPLDSGNSILTDLELWLPLTDGLGTTAVDISGGGNDGTLATTNLWSFKKIGECFDGSTGSHISGTGVNLGSSSGTLSMWFKADSEQNNKYMLSLPYASAGSNGFDIAAITGGCRIDLATSAGFKQLSYTTQNVQDGGIYHIVAAYDGSSIYLYVNGVRVATTTHTGTINQQVDGEFNINRFGSYGRPADGHYQNVRVWSRALSDSEVADLYYSPWIASAYPSTSTGAPRFLINGLRPLLVNGGLVR